MHSAPKSEKSAIWVCRKLIASKAKNNVFFRILSNGGTSKEEDPQSVKKILKKC